MLRVCVGYVCDCETRVCVPTALLPDVHVHTEPCEVGVLPCGVRVKCVYARVFVRHIVMCTECLAA